MKQQSAHSVSLLLFLFFLVTTPQTIARLLAPKQGEEAAKLNEITTRAPFVELEEIQENDSLNLMGLEVCHSGDEDCVKRRMIAEAHLDYIYTQHHKP
ncbi:putative phytosulfokines 6 isoform X2 [Diospyros lotus]|uniref:putative phytosulfokines 6 isoform X2 n=1 Tax=Diospyros lotus TaxID=55363 RepID=UPI00225A3425|nr:putative phytosulfokines 6 isoform X2 [Diospyros lotus]